jgi:hypothetical protein
MEQQEKRGRGRPVGQTQAAGYKSGRPPGTPTTLSAKEAATRAKAQVLREHLEQPANPSRPHLGTTYELVKEPLAQQLPKPRRLTAWWGGHRIHLTEEEITACWKWLLPH